MRKVILAGTITRTGWRVNHACPYCGDGAIFDYKTDHHDNGSKNSYKECRNCGHKIDVKKRMTKQKTERNKKQKELKTLMDELLKKGHIRENKWWRKGQNNNLKYMLKLERILYEKNNLGFN